MKQGHSSLKSPLFISILFSIMAFGGAFWLSLLRDRDQTAELGRLAQAHLIYALQLKDDMAVIDWAGHLEKSNHVLAFRATSPSKTLIAGGNENFIPTEAPSGLSYRFPSDWIYSWERVADDPNSNRFILVYRASPSPLLVGFVVFIACFLVGYVLTRLTPRYSPTHLVDQGPSGSKIAPASRRSSLQSIPSPSKVENEKTFLFLDKNYVIQKISPEAARLLERHPSQLLNRHLFDLLPDPALMRAIEKGEEVRFLKPFSSHPSLSISLKPDLNGTLLFLESPPAPEALEKL